MLKDCDKSLLNNSDNEQKYFEEFYSEVFLEISKRYGKIRKLYISENINNHMRGNVYAQVLISIILKKTYNFVIK